MNNNFDCGQLTLHDAKMTLIDWKRMIITNLLTDRRFVEKAKKGGGGVSFSPYQ